MKQARCKRGGSNDVPKNESTAEDDAVFKATGVAVVAVCSPVVFEVQFYCIRIRT